MVKVYEFWLASQEGIEELAKTFHDLGEPFIRKVDRGAVGDDLLPDGTPNPNAGKLLKGGAVYSVSINPRTDWVQLLVDDNTPIGILTAIEARIEAFRDDEPVRRYEDGHDTIAPIERPKQMKLGDIKRLRAERLKRMGL